MVVKYIAPISVHTLDLSCHVQIERNVFMHFLCKDNISKWGKSLLQFLINVACIFSQCRMNHFSDNWFLSGKFLQTTSASFQVFPRRLFHFGTYPQLCQLMEQFEFLNQLRLCFIYPNVYPWGLPISFYTEITTQKTLLCRKWHLSYLIATINYLYLSIQYQTNVMDTSSSFSPWLQRNWFIL